jgi:hypothetical protein
MVQLGISADFSENLEVCSRLTVKRGSAPTPTFLFNEREV